MKSVSRIVLLLAALSLFAMACGLGNTATDKINEAVDSAATQVVEKVATTVATAMPEAGTVVAEVQEAATQVAEQPAAADTPEASGENNDAEGQTEEAPIDVPSINESLANLDSYKSELKMTFDGKKGDGTPTSGAMTMLQEAIKEPPASHFRMEFSGDAAEDMGGADSFEMYIVDGMTYMQDPESGEWMSFPAGDSMDFGMMMVSADDFVDLPENAHRDLLPKTVNGISTWHYTFTEKDLPPDEQADIKSVKGEVWIARDGDFPVKLIMEIDGKSIDGEDDADFFTEGIMKIEYELKSVNENFTITVPEEAKNATSMFGGDDDSEDGGSVPDVDIPMPDDANVEFSMAGMTSFTTTAGVDEMVDFYRTKFAAMGWDNDPDSDFIDETGGFLLFTHDNNEISVIIDASDGNGTTTVTVMSQ